MKIIREVRAACAVNAAVIGVSFLSGREAASFFACTGKASWAGIAAASVLFGLLMGMICHFVQETGARDLPEIYYRKLDERCGDAISVVHALMMLMMGAAALSTAGEAGMLALDTAHPYAISASVAVVAALLLSLGRMRFLSALGLFMTPAAILFFAALAIDPRPVRAGAYAAEYSMDLNGSLPVGVLLGALFAFLKSAMTCGVAAVCSRGVRPRVFASVCAGVTFVTLSAADWALIKAGDEVCALNIPTVVMAARWGIVGYYICTGMMLVGASAVLSASIGSLAALFPASVKRPAASLMSAAGIVIMSFTGLRPLVSVGYPMMGWISALCLCALAVFYERREKSNVKFTVLH